MSGFGISPFVGFPWGGIFYPEPAIPGAGPVPRGLLEAITGAIGEADNEIGGYTLTRLTADVSAGATALPVETTVDWPDSGKLALDGIVYHYTAKTLTEFSGIYYLSSGNVVTGTAIAHKIDAPVADINRMRNALERLRRSFLVDYAEETDLAEVGQNLGVPKLPIFETDDQYRAVIKAVAYSPRGTIYGIEMALEAFLGTGNWEIYEDLIKYPNIVFIILDATAFLKTIFEGKGFMNNEAYAELSGSQDTITLPNEPISIESIRLADLGELFDFRDEIPSDITYPYYPEATPDIAFDYQGSISEGTGVSLSPGEYTQFAITGGLGTVYYRMQDIHGARILPESEVVISCLAKIPSTDLTAGKLEQFSIAIFDGRYRISAGLDNDLSFGLFDTEAGGFLGATVTLIVGDVYEIVIKKYGTRYVELWVDGQFISRVDYSSFAEATTDHKIEFGLRGTPALNFFVQYKQLGINIHTDTDFTGARSNNANTSSSYPTRVTLWEGDPYIFVSSDIGKRFTLPDGIYQIDSLVSDTEIEVTGEDQIDAIVETANFKRITIPNEDFVYPNDLGKEIIISGSVLGNNGTYVIDKLLEPGSFTDLSTFDTPILTRTNVCEVVAAAFTSEVGLDWKLVPVFGDATDLEWEQSGASSFSGMDITLRQSLWTNGLLMYVKYSDVLSAQLLLDDTIRNGVVKYYPLYIADTFGNISLFLDGLTIGGVIPEFLLRE